MEVFLLKEILEWKRICKINDRKKSFYIADSLANNGTSFEYPSNTFKINIVNFYN